MMKATAESALIESCDLIKHGEIKIIIARWFARVKRFMPHPSSPNKRVADVADKSTTHKSAFRKNGRGIGIFITRLLRQQKNAQLVKQRIKDEFFFSGNIRSNTRRKNIPQRTWKRHSALLVYRQQMQEINQPLGAGQVSNPAREKPVAAEARISLQVQSIRPLPVWSSALHEMTWIESDLSSLRFQKMSEVAPLAVEAA